MLGSAAVSAGVLGAAPAGGIFSAWSIGTFLQNATQTAQGWAGLAMILVGVVAIAFGGISILIGLMRKNNGGQPIQWVPLILCIILGGAFFVGGWSFANSVAQSANETVATLGTEQGMGDGGGSYDFGDSN